VEKRIDSFPLRLIFCSFLGVRAAIFVVSISIKLDQNDGCRLSPVFAGTAETSLKVLPPVEPKDLWLDASSH
jgi:hypothetical protein